MNSLRPLAALLVLLLGLASGSAGTVVRFHTTVGDFDVELFDSDKPATVQNFLSYVRGGLYTNMFMHRVVPDFVIQGGGFNVQGRGTANPGIAYVPTLAPVTNEFNVGRPYSNVYGTIAMAKTENNPDSATSQFFFNLADNSAALDNTNNNGGFTVFGRVIAGTNVLNTFQIGPNNRMIKQLNAGGVFNQLPVLYLANPDNITFDDLIYVNVSTPQAAYNGLFAPPESEAQGVSGFITMNTTPASRFTGSLRLGAARYAFSGSLDTNGYAVATATSAKREPLLVNLHPDPALGTEKLVGTITSSNWVAEVAAYRAGFDGRTSLATDYLGKYTLALQGSGQIGLPGGYGFASMGVNAAGKALLKGSLADGTPFSQAVPLSRDGHFPLYAPLYAKGGFVSGWMTFTNEPGAELQGSLHWFKPASAKGWFTNGFTSELTAAGGRYTPPAPGTLVLGSTNSLAFGGGSLTLSFTNNLTLTTANKLLNTSTNKLTVSLALSSGLFSGRVTPPGSLRSFPFKGALWQKQNSGYGYFLDAGQSGWALLQDAAPQTLANQLGASAAGQRTGGVWFLRLGPSRLLPPWN